MSYFHSVTLNKDKCQGCTNCIKRCPTEAIRVRGGKARIIKERCIDCGECIRVCPYHAKLALTDPLAQLAQYSYTVALPAPSLYGQFQYNNDINKVLTAIKKIGFDDVFEVARGAEYVSAATRILQEEGRLPVPAISSACPAALRLIMVQFPNLIPNIVPLLSPMEVAAKLAREKAAAKTGLPDEDIGVFFITPCPAKVTSIKAPLRVETSYVNGAVSVNDVYPKILAAMKEISEPEQLAVAGVEGISWSRCGGESDGAGAVKCISVDGIDNVMKVLEEIEDDKIEDVDFIELAACTGGCVGGALNVANPFIASNRIKNMVSNCTAKADDMSNAVNTVLCQRELEPIPVMKLDDDLERAMEKMEEIDRLYANTPKLDCGSCGAPSCRAHAEDVVRGYVGETDCIFKMRERVRDLAMELFDLESHPYGMAKGDDRRFENK